MPTYAYHCVPCDCEFEEILPISRYDEPQNCPECGLVARKLITPFNFNLVGDGWVGKNERIRKQMASRSVRASSKMDELKRDQPSVSLAPNVNGERVESWSEAKKLAESQGKVGSTYDPMIRKEKSLQK